MIREILAKKKKEKQRREKIKAVKRFAAGAAAGITAGAVSGILLAPKAGKETREDIAKGAKELGENVKTKTVEIKETVENKVTETKGNIVEAKEKISKYLADKKAARGCCKCDEEVIVEENKEIQVGAETEE